jgi:hypothetical protein
MHQTILSAQPTSAARDRSREGKPAELAPAG